MRGHQITGYRNGKYVTRDAQKWKKLKEKKEQPRQADCEDYSSDDDIFPRGPRVPDNAEGPVFRSRGEPIGGAIDPPTARTSVNEERQEDAVTVRDAPTPPPAQAPQTADNSSTTADRRITRSQGTVYTWNPVMNAGTGPLIHPAQ